MSDQEDRRRTHLVVSGLAQAEPFGRPPRVIQRAANIPERDRPQHGGFLAGRIAALHQSADQARNAQMEAGIDDGLGIQIEFESFPDIALAFESLGNANRRIELLNVRMMATGRSPRCLYPMASLIISKRWCVSI